MSAERVIPAPPENVEHTEFWAACNDGKLIRHAALQGHQSVLFLSPQNQPFHPERQRRVVEASGNGEIHSYP